MITSSRLSRKGALRAVLAVGAAAAVLAMLPTTGAAQNPNRISSDTAPVLTADTEDIGYYVVESDIQSGALRTLLRRADIDTLDARAAKGVAIAASAEQARWLEGRGFTVTRTGDMHHPVDPSREQRAGTFYGGYHTTAGHKQHNAEVARAHPGLVTKYEIGPTWLKEQGRGGHEIEALCITKKQAGDCELNTNGKKPRFTFMAQMHSREIASSEVAYMWIDELVTKYGQDPEITKLMDTTEMWVLPNANPDGLDIVAGNPNRPVLQRKNAHENGCTGTGKGTDLNRNSGFHWDRNQGTKCSQTYPGTGPDSEPETRAIEGLLSKIYRDTKPDSDFEPAAKDTTGVFLTLHSFASLNIFPYGWTNTEAPNHADLKRIADLAHQYNRYQVVHGDGGLNYFAPGATDDWLYGRLGVPGYTIELGGDTRECNGFFAPYSCMKGYWEGNRGALIAMAKAAAKPYRD